MSQYPELLRKAEQADGFQDKCKRCPVNSAARAMCSYTAWPDQSLAATADAIINDPAVRSIILHPTAEGGMPHTRPNIICLPAYYPEVKLRTTLTHEMIHISQRRQPSLWASRCAVEGWKAVDEDDIPQEWVRRSRLNPDTAANRWLAWDGHVPLPLFVREDRPELRDVVVRWYDMEEGLLRSQPPASLVKKYGSLGTSSMEHPYELWAYQSETCSNAHIR
jgi:hypothetical protein